MRQLVGYFKVVWLIALLLFVGLYIFRHTEQIEYFLETLPTETICWAFSFLMTAKLLLTLSMFYCLRMLGLKLSLFECFYIYNVTTIAKYIPGNIWHFVGKIGYYRAKGFNASQIRDSILVETLWVLFGAGITGVLFLFFSGVGDIPNISVDYKKYSWIGIIILSVLLAISYGYFRKLITIMVQQIGFTSLLFLIQLFFWFFIGLSFYLIADTYISSANPIFFVYGLYAIAYIIGFITPFSPGGIGIREGILVGGLVSFMPAQQALLVAGFHRILYLIAEAILALLSFALMTFSKNTKLKLM